MRKRNAPPGATISDVPLAVPAAGLNIVTVGITTFLTIPFGPVNPGTCIVCSCQSHFSKPGGTPAPVLRD